MLADIVSGKTGTADVLFLIAAIVFGLAFIAEFLSDRAKVYYPALVAAGLTIIAIAFLVL